MMRHSTPAESVNGTKRDVVSSWIVIIHTHTHTRARKFASPFYIGLTSRAVVDVAAVFLVVSSKSNHSNLMIQLLLCPAKQSYGFYFDLAVYKWFQYKLLY